MLDVSHGEVISQLRRELRGAPRLWLERHCRGDLEMETLLWWLYLRERDRGRNPGHCRGVFADRRGKN